MNIIPVSVVSIDVDVDDRASGATAQLAVEIEAVDGLQSRLGHADGADGVGEGGVQ